MIYSNRIGGWSTEGLTIDRSNSNNTLVTCLTTHLTSFAVLVSIQDERPVRTESIFLFFQISYIILQPFSLMRHYQLSHTLDALFH